MNISIDFDDTYTRDPDMWITIIAVMRAAGHKVYCVTARSPEQGLEVFSTIGRLVGADSVHFTSLHAKKAYMWSKGISIDVWIDDNPDAITRGFLQSPSEIYENFKQNLQINS